MFLMLVLQRYKNIRMICLDRDKFKDTKLFPCACFAKPRAHVVEAFNLKVFRTRFLSFHLSRMITRLLRGIWGQNFCYHCITKNSKLIETKYYFNLIILLDVVEQTRGHIIYYQEYHYVKDALLHDKSSFDQFVTHEYSSAFEHSVAHLSCMVTIG